MVNKNKILSDLSKIAVDAFSTIAGLKKEVENIVNLRVNKLINKMDLIRRDEFDNLKKIVQAEIIEKKNKSKNTSILKKNTKKALKKKKKSKKA
tara:strand:- start:146 stop:427 length:282 start_codon:yes stop_codon:yes gene_type:complete